MFQRTAWKRFLIPVGVIVLLVCILVSGKIAPVKATDTAQNMRALLEEWKQQADNGNGTLSFEFNTPLIKGDDTWWFVPYTDQKAELERNIGDIGDDYVCFVERWGQNFDTVTRCTPFSNIAEVASGPS